MKISFWKIYFWTGMVLLVLNISLLFFSGENSKFADWASPILYIPAYIGLYSFVYKKKFYSARFWQVILWMTIFLDAYHFAYNSLTLKNILPEILRFSNYEPIPLIAYVILFLILNTPFIFAPYQLGYSSNWHLRKDKKIYFSFVNPKRSIWWKVSAAIAILNGLNLIIPISGEIKNPEDLVVGFMMFFAGVLIWKRINLALLFYIILTILSGIYFLVLPNFAEFIFDVIIFALLLITALKVYDFDQGIKTMKKMFKEKKNLVMILALIIILTIGRFVYWRTRPETQLLYFIEKKIVQEQDARDFAQWTKYENKKLGFAFYHPDLGILGRTDSTEPSLQFQNKSSAVHSFNMDLDAFPYDNSKYDFATLVNDRERDSNESRGLETVAKKSIDLDGKKGFLLIRKSSLNKDAVGRVINIFLTPKSIYFLSFELSLSDGLNNSNDTSRLSIFMQILSTFKFVEER